LAERHGGIQSIDRAFDVLERLAAAGQPVGISQLAAESGLPLPTIYRLVRSLVANGYVRQDASKRYTLGVRGIILGDAARRSLGPWARPHLEELVDATSETANMAILEGDVAVYVAQAPSRHAMRMFTEVGRRVMLHSTGVGKALLSQLDDTAVRRLVRRGGLVAQTDRTIADERTLLRALAEVRERGYAVDDGEQEVGVRCIAMSVPRTPGNVAVSVSGPSARIPDDQIESRIVPALRRTAEALAEQLEAAPDDE